MLEYQKQDCQLTLREGLECYYQSFPKSKEILKDSSESGYLLRDHDCTHVIFGLDSWKPAVETHDFNHPGCKSPIAENGREREWVYCNQGNV